MLPRMARFSSTPTPLSRLTRRHAALLEAVPEGETLVLSKRGAELLLAAGVVVVVPPANDHALVAEIVQGVCRVQLTSAGRAWLAQRSASARTPRE